MSDSMATEFLVLISMNVLSMPITAIQMRVVQIIVDHSVVNVKMDIKAMVLHVPMLMSVLMGTIGATLTLLAQILLEATNASVMLDTMVTGSIAVTSMNVLKASAM